EAPNPAAQMHRIRRSAIDERNFAAVDERKLVAADECIDVGRFRRTLAKQFSQLDVHRALTFRNLPLAASCRAFFAATSRLSTKRSIEPLSRVTHADGRKRRDMSCIRTRSEVFSRARAFGNRV